MDYKDRCRTCLGEEKEMRHIEAVISIAGSKVRLSDILNNFYEFKVSPEEYHIYPQYICINCVHHLTLTYSFKSLIENSARILSENINSIEALDEKFDYDYDQDEDYKPKIEKKISSYKNLNIKPITFARRSHIIIKRNPSFERQLFCVECKAEFHTSKSLNEHCANIHPAKSTTGRDCEYCHEKFEDFKELVIHRKLHLKPFLCLTCWTGFYNESDFKTHKCQPHLNRRTTNEKVLRQCDQCGKSYPPGYIKIHMATHGNELRYSCKYCPKKFKVANGLNSHVLWNHKRTRDHKCDVCGAMFISASARSSHIRKNHLKEKKYGCESCAKRFFSKSELQRHTLTHTGVKNFHCHLCDKSYQTRYGLNVHLKSHAHMSVNVLNL